MQRSRGNQTQDLTYRIPPSIRYNNVIQQQHSYNGSSKVDPKNQERRLDTHERGFDFARFLVHYGIITKTINSIQTIKKGETKNLRGIIDYRLLNEVSLS